VCDKKVTKEARLPTAVRQNSLRDDVATFKQLPEVGGTARGVRDACARTDWGVVARYRGLGRE